MNDPLQGYRGAPTRDAYDELEREVQAYRALAEDDVDIENLSHVLKKDALVQELANESSALRRLVSHAQQVLEYATRRWVEQANPQHEQAINAHRDARAARLVIDWVDEQISVGKQAERQLEND